MAVTQSILNGTKKNLGLNEADDSFDHDVITHINSAFFTLNQLGIGPEDGFFIEDDEDEWGDYVTDLNRSAKNALQSYIYLYVRLIFDPPGTPHHIQAMKDQQQELVYRLQMERELTAWVPPSSLLSLP